MPIHLVTGNIFDSGADVLVNAVNCVGVMGAGLAKQFAERYPEMLKGYQQVCADQEIDIGRPHWYCLRNGQWICNFPTKFNPHEYSVYPSITWGMGVLTYQIHYTIFGRIKSVAIPALGCGLGGLDWFFVKPIIIAAMNTLPDVTTYIYEPKE